MSKQNIDEKISYQVEAAKFRNKDFDHKQNDTDDNGNNFLHILCKDESIKVNKWLGIARYIVQKDSKHAERHLPNKCGETPLMLFLRKKVESCEYDSKNACVKLFIDNGAIFNFEEIKNDSQIDPQSKKYFEILSNYKNLSEKDKDIIDAPERRKNLSAKIFIVSSVVFNAALSVGFFFSGAFGGPLGIAAVRAACYFLAMEVLSCFALGRTVVTYAAKPTLEEQIVKDAKFRADRTFMPSYIVKNSLVCSIADREQSDSLSF